MAGSVREGAEGMQHMSLEQYLLLLTNSDQRYENC
jgi:hypothetical protein